jgi:YggT family protein
MLGKIISLVINFIQLYSYMLIIWVIGSWFPQLQSTGFYEYIDKLVYPYAKLFRGLLPPIGALDFSVILAFITLGIIQHLLGKLI